MTTLKSIYDSLDSTFASITPAALGPVPLEFASLDTISVPPGGFSAIYAFGDSLSDTGNISFATAGLLPVGDGIYSDGRFSNGNIWVQDLEANLKLPALTPSLRGGTDYAYGGAETGATPVHALNPSDLPLQLLEFDTNVPKPSPTALYAVWAGSNDVLDIANSTETPSQQLVSVATAVSNETALISGLVAHGAKNLVVMDVPDLGKTPYEMARPTSDATSAALAETYNAELGTALQKIVASGAAAIDYVNTFGLMDMATANPGAYGLTNVTQPVWTGNLTDPHSGVLNATGAAQNGYLFFDDLHPTAAGHALLADAVTQTLTGTA